MKVVNCYWQDWAWRIRCPESSFHCANDREVQECKDEMKRAGVSHMEVIDPDEYKFCSSLLWETVKGAL